MYFIYETCNKYLHLNCHHFKNTKIAYYISVNVIISLTNSSLATIFPQFVTTYHQKSTLLYKKISLTVKLRKTVNILILFQQVIVVLINHAYQVSLKYGRNPLATKYAPLLFPFFSSNLISLFSKTLIFFVFMVFKVSP